MDKSSPVTKFALRAILLFVLLALCKTALLVNLGDHLYQTHYRLDFREPTPATYLAAGFLTVLLFVSLLCLTKRSCAAPLVENRGLVLWLGFFAFLFAILSLHRMRSNYLYILTAKLLHVRDIADYLILDFFFTKPFLAVYCVGFIVASLSLWRKQREYWMFSLLGVAICIYVGFNPSVFFSYQRELFLLICVGLLSLGSALHNPKPLSWRWQLIPFLFILGGLLALIRRKEDLFALTLCHGVLISLALGFLIGSNFLFRRHPGYPLLSHFLPFYVLCFYLLTSHHHPCAANFNYFVIYGLALPQYLWQEALVVLALTAMALIISRYASRAGLILFDCAAFGLLLLAIADVQLNQRMGFRLDWQALTANTDPILLWRTIRPFIGQFLLLLLLLAAAYYGFILFGLKKWSHPLSGSASRNTFAFALCSLALLSVYSIHCITPDKAQGFSLVKVVKSSPWLAKSHDALPCDQVEPAARSLGLPIFPPSESTRKSTRSAGNLNVLLIIQESMYNRYLSLFGAEDETQPRLKAYQHRMELFPNFYSNFAESLNSRFAVLSGIYPCKPAVAFVNPRIESPSLFDALHARQYHVSLFYSSYRDYQRWNDYLVCRKIDSLYDADNMPGREQSKNVSWGVREDVTLNAIKQQLSAHTASGQKFFLTYVPAAPHMPYDSPSKQFEKFFNGAPSVDNNYVGRFKNQLLYMDWIISSILEHLEQIGQLDKTLVVITTDHGELLGDDNGKLGHGWFLDPRLCNVPLIVMNPRQQERRLNYTLGSQVDIMPTVLDLLGLPMPAGHLYEGVSLYSETANQNKTVYITAYHQRAKVQGDTYFLEEPGPSGSDQGGTLSTFKITFNDSRTTFQALQQQPLPASTIAPFERFQHSFVVNYSKYRDYFAERLAPVSSPPAVVSVQP